MLVFQSHTTLPRYPQSNGKAKNAVKTLKLSFLKNARIRVSLNFKPCWIGVTPQQTEWLLALRNG